MPARIERSVQAGISRSYARVGKVVGEDVQRREWSLTMMWNCWVAKMKKTCRRNPAGLILPVNKVLNYHPGQLHPLSLTPDPGSYQLFPSDAHQLSGRF